MMRLTQIVFLLFALNLAGYSQSNSKGGVVILTTSKSLYTTNDVVDFAVLADNPGLNYADVDLVDKLGSVVSTRTIKLKNGIGEGSLVLEGEPTGFYRLFASGEGIEKEPFQLIKVFDHNVVKSTPQLVQRVLFQDHFVEVDLSELFDLEGLSLNFVDSLIPINNFLLTGNRMTIPTSFFEGLSSFQIMRGAVEIDDLKIPNSGDKITIEVVSLLTPGEPFSIEIVAESGPKFENYVVSVTSEMAVNDAITFESGVLVPNYSGTKTRMVNPIVTNAAALAGEPSLLYSYFQPYHLVKETRIESLEDISLSVPDVYEDNYVWNYAFDKMGNRLGVVDIKRVSHQKRYEPFTETFRITDVELEFVKKKRMQEVVKKAFAIKNPPKPAVNYDDNIADNTVLTINYVLPPSMAEFIVSGVPKATIKKRKGQRLILMSANGTQEKFPNSPMFMIDDKFTFDCEEVLALDVNDIVKIELFNSRSALRDFGLLGSNGVMRIFTSKSEATYSGFKVQGLHERNSSHLMSLPDAPDLRDLLAFELGSNLGASTRSIWAKAPNSVGSYIIKIVAIDDQSVVHTISKRVRVEGK